MYIFTWCTYFRKICSIRYIYLQSLFPPSEMYILSEIPCSTLHFIIYCKQKICSQKYRDDIRKKEALCLIHDYQKYDLCELSCDQFSINIMIHNISYNKLYQFQRMKIVFRKNVLKFPVSCRSSYTIFKTTAEFSISNISGNRSTIAKETDFSYCFSLI